MGVVNGQPVNASVTNAAFLDADSDDTALGKINLNNISDPTNSGTVINNAQRELNSLAYWVGKTTNIAKDTDPTWTNNDVGTPTDNVKARADSLTQKFNDSAGHTHTGAPGDAPPLSGASISGVPYRGLFVRAIDLTGASGFSTDVSTELTGETPSTAGTILGVVVNLPYNKVILRQATGVNTGDEIVDGSGNEVYGRVTESAGVWTLTYYVDLSGTETAYSLPSTDVAWYYQKIYDPMVATPVYDPGAFIPSDNATADVIDATESLAGKVILSNVVATSVGSSNVKGTSTRVSHQDHEHQGIHALQEFTEAVNVFGDIVLKAGTGMTITRTSQTFEFSSSGSSNQAVDYFTLSAGDITAKQVTLSLSPGSPSKVLLDVIGGGSQVYSTDFTVSGAILSWASLALDGVLSAGDQLRVSYSADLQVEYHTLTSGEITAKQLTLAGTPASAAQTIVDLIGGAAQVYSTDFVVSGAVLDWTGLGLDGLLVVGDILRITYRV